MLLTFIFLIFLAFLLVSIFSKKPLNYKSKEYIAGKFFGTDTIGYTKFTLANNNISFGLGFLTLSTEPGVLHVVEPDTDASFTSYVGPMHTHLAVKNTNALFCVDIGTEINMFTVERALNGFSGIKKLIGSDIKAPNVQGKDFFGNIIDVDDIGTTLFVSSCMEDQGKGRVYIYERMNKTPIQILSGTRHFGFAMACAKDASYLVCSDGKNTKIFNRDNNGKYNLSAALPISACKIITSNDLDSRYIAISGAKSLNFTNIDNYQYEPDNKVYIYKKLPQGYVKIKTIHIKNGGVIGRSLSFSENGTLIISAKSLETKGKTFETSFLMIRPDDEYVSEPVIIHPNLKGDYTSQCKFFTDSIIIAIGKDGHIFMTEKIY